VFTISLIDDVSTGFLFYIIHDILFVILLIFSIIDAIKSIIRSGVLFIDDMVSSGCAGLGTVKYDVRHHGPAVHLRMKKSPVLPAVMSGKIHTLRKAIIYLHVAHRRFVKHVVVMPSPCLEGQP
jgi:hypothetical protein